MKYDRTADAPLLPPELLFRMNNGEANKGEDRMKRDAEFVNDDFFYDDETEKYPADATVEFQSKKSMKRKSKAPKKDELGNKFVDMYSTIYSMKQEMDRIRRPVGTKDNPVRTCKDLYFGHPQFEDGKLPLFLGCMKLNRISQKSLFTVRLVLDRSESWYGRRCSLCLLQFNSPRRDLYLS